MPQTEIKALPDKMFPGRLSDLTLKRAESRYLTAAADAGLILSGDKVSAYPPTTALDVSKNALGISLYEIYKMPTGVANRFAIEDTPSILSFGRADVQLLAGANPSANDPVYVYRGATVANRGKVTQDGSAADVTRLPGAKFTGDKMTGLAEVEVSGVPSDNVGAAGAGLGTIPILFGSLFDPDGDPIVKFVDGASAVPGINLADSEAVNLRWNNNGTLNAVIASVPIPSDLDPDQDMTLEFLCSKSGATVGDATTITATVFLLTVGMLHDADANAGGVTNAITGNAPAKTTALLTRTIAAADIPDGAISMSVAFGPTGGTLGTDDFMIHSACVRYRKR